MMRISVVVPALNAERTIGACVESVLRQSRPAHELIVVDNGSRDRTVEVVSRWAERHAPTPLVLLAEPRPGPSAARNRGIRAASGDVVAFTDADCVADVDWLRGLGTAFEDETIAGVAGNIRGHRPRGLLEKFQSLFTLRWGRDQEQAFDRYTLVEGGFPAANLGVRRQVLETLGGFDESLEIYGEDHDLCRRIYAAGGRIKAILGATVFHVHRPTLSGFLRQNFGFGRGHAQTLARGFRRAWRIDVPGGSVQTEALPGRVWIDLTALDKKVALLVAAGLVYPPLWLLGPAYLWRLAGQVRRRAAGAGMATTGPERVAMVGCFLLKCLAIDCGRWYGSLRYRVVCV